MQEMLRRVHVHGQEIEQIFYQGRPVVTYEQIALVHGIPVANVHRAFQRHRTKFVAGEDYFLLDFAEASSLELRVQANSNGLTLFTEDGYLLLVKPLRDTVSWEVQRAMRAAYFRDQEREHAALSPESALDRSLLRLADLMGVGYSKLQDEINSVGQNSLARIEDEQRARERADQAILNHQQKKDQEVDDLKKTVESIATVAAGPYPGIMVNSPHGYLRNRLEMLGRDRRVPVVHLKAFKAHLRENYPIRSQNGEELYAQEDLRVAYDTPGFGTIEHKHLAGDERLIADQDDFLAWCDEHPKQRVPKTQFPRVVKSPRMYKPRSEDSA